MTHFLDELPLDFSNPGVQDLVRILADNYYSERLATPLILQAGIPLARVNLNQPMEFAWPEVLVEARRRDAVRGLLEVIANSPDTAIAGRISELLAAAPVIPAPSSPGPVPAAVAPDIEDGVERQIESQPTLLDVSFLQRGLELAPSVARLLVTMSGQGYYGTGFRIGEDLLLTNHHVLFDNAGPASRVEAWFGYERSFAGAERQPQVVECLPASIVGRADHDWAVVRTATPMPAQAEIIPLTGAPAPKPLDRVYIIQHPSGGVKKIGMIHNVVADVTEDVVQYRTDTEGGSSGSPVFDERWRVIALHHRWGSRRLNGKVEYYNQGRRIERVVAGLRKEGQI